MEDRPGFAASFNGTTAHVLLPADELYDFRQALSVSVFLKTDEITAHEQHPVSHGSWEHRYKISITGDRIRFTLNTTSGIKDLDSETRIEPGTWYHIAAVYTGTDMELWVNGELDAFTTHTGLINTSPLQPVLGQNLPGNNNFNFKGAMSLLSIYDFPLSPLQIDEQLSVFVQEMADRSPVGLLLFPNPIGMHLGIIRVLPGKELSGKVNFEIYDVRGVKIHQGVLGAEKVLEVPLLSHLQTGIYLLRIMAEGYHASGTFIITK
jgi:hypothetical protein